MNLEKIELEPATTWKLVYLSADNFKKILDLDGSTPEPAIRSSDTGQRVPCFDSCQLIKTLMSNMCALSVFLCSQTSKSMRLNVVRDQEGVINSWARLSDVPGHRDVTAKSSVRRAEFSKMAVLLFFMWTLWAYFFPCNKAAMWFLFWSRIPLPYIPTEEVSVFWLLRENSAKKVSEAFWWVRCGISLKKKSFFSG